MHRLATTFLLVTLSNINRFKKNSLTDAAINSFLIWLLATPTHLKYVATLSCNLSLIACFLAWMFHKVVWQHMQGVLMTTLLQIYQRIFQWKKWKSVKIWENYGHGFVASFFGPLCWCSTRITTWLFTHELELSSVRFGRCWLTSKLRSHHWHHVNWTTLNSSVRTQCERLHWNTCVQN